jgi:hypothetical protein
MNGNSWFLRYKGGEPVIANDPPSVFATLSRSLDSRKWKEICRVDGHTAEISKAAWLVGG